MLYSVTILGLGACAAMRPAVLSHGAARVVTPAITMAEPAPPAGFVWADTEDDAAPAAAPAAAAPAASGAVEPVACGKLTVHSNAAEVSQAIVDIVNNAAADAIAKRGHFALAIPGGSVLTMLKGSSPSWASKCTLAYVNHKAVPMDDAKLATHAKAGALFLDQWEGCNAIVMDGTDDAKAEAEAYEAKMQALPETVLPRDASGLPVFDLMLIGVGDDGHVGSLYPGREEVLDASGKWVLPVEMKVPGSITLSLPVMQASKQAVIAACGVSEKYPQGKSEAMARGIEGTETPTTFPAVGLRSVATWHLDIPAASALSSDYAESFSLELSRGDCSPDNVN